MNELIEFLHSVMLFNGFDDKEFGQVAQLCNSIRFKAGAIILAEDSHGRELYIIRNGRVSITMSPPPNELDGMATTCSSGQVVGELGFIDGARRSTWVIAMDAVDAVKIEWNSFEPLIAQQKETGCKFMHNLALLLAERLRDTTMLCSNLLGVR